MLVKSLTPVFEHNSDISGQKFSSNDNTSGLIPIFVVFFETALPKYIYIYIHPWSDNCNQRDRLKNEIRKRNQRRR